jgi:paraquat-inducible protein B
MTDVPQARVQIRRFPLIWLLPIAAVGIALWLGVRTLGEHGPLVTITLSSGEGLEAGRTRVLLRNVEVGTVESLELSKDLTHVVVNARIRRDLRPYLTTGTKFWVVRPRLGAGGVSGLNTLFSGAYLEIWPGKGERTEKFEGLDEPPLQAPSGEGKTFLLRSRELGGLSRGSPVYYRGLQVGEVLGSALAQDSQSVGISIFVRAPHDALVHPETRFWNASGFELRTGAGGFRAKMESLQAVLLGGVGFETREESPRSAASPRDAEFPLYADAEAVRSAPYGPEISYLLRVGASVRGLEVDSPVELLGIRVGKVTDIHLEGEGGRVHAVVTVSLEPERSLLHETALPADPKELRPLVDHELGVLIDHGLRAELKSVSLLTGARVVALSFRPGAPKARLLPGSPFPEIPGAPSPDFDGLTESATQLLTDARRLVNSANSVIASPALTDTLKNLDQITQQTSENIGPTMQSLQKASAQLEKTLAATSGLLGNSNTGTGELPRALRDLREASRSVKLLSDYLERHPEALLRGKQGP